MIKNPIIVEKVEQKTKNDPDMRQFIRDILEKESDGKHYRKFYTSQIAIFAKRDQRKKGE